MVCRNGEEPRFLMETTEYDLLSFSESRRATMDTGRLGLSKHYMFCLLEVDVTRARQELRLLRRSGQPVSFTAWIVKTIGDSVAANTYVHAASFGRNRLVMFRDADIAIPVESSVGEGTAPLPLLIKATNRKSMQEIDREIQAAVSRRIEDERDYILSSHSFSRTALRLYYRLPQWLRVLALKVLVADPLRARRISGTVTVTTVNAIGESSGWILPTRSWHNLLFALGTISKKPWVVKGEVKIREILNLTVAFTHDVVDGAPARRFMQHLVRRMEAGTAGAGQRPPARTAEPRAGDRGLPSA